GVIYGEWRFEPQKPEPEMLDYVQEGRPSLLVRTAQLSPLRGMRIILAKPVTWFGTHRLDDIRPHARNALVARQAHFEVGETGAVSCGPPSSRLYAAHPSSPPRPGRGSARTAATTSARTRATRSSRARRTAKSARPAPCASPMARPGIPRCCTPSARAASRYGR